MKEFIEEIVLETFENKSDIERIFLTDYVKHKAGVLLARNLIDKQDLMLADILAISAYSRETRLLNEVMSITCDQIEKENAKC